MKTHIEFQSEAFSAVENDTINPNRWGKKLADFLASELPNYGLKVDGVFAEDWGWIVEIENANFPLWLGCGNRDETEDGYLVFIEPSKPYVRKWLKKIPTMDKVERVAEAVEAILRSHDQVEAVKWWDEDEV